MAELPLIGEIDKLSFADERIIHQVSGVVHGGCASCLSVFTKNNLQKPPNHREYPLVSEENQCTLH